MFPQSRAYIPLHNIMLYVVTGAVLRSLFTTSDKASYVNQAQHDCAGLTLLLGIGVCYSVEPPGPDSVEQR